MSREDPNGLAVAALERGDELRATDPVAAADSFRAAIELMREAENPTGEAEACVRLASLLWSVGDFKDTREQADYALTLIDEWRHPKLAGLALFYSASAASIGDTMMDLEGRFRYSASLLDRAGDPLHAAHALVALAEIQSTTLHADKARASMLQAADRYDKVGRHASAASARMQGASLALQAGDIKSAKIEAAQAYEKLVGATGVQGRVRDADGAEILADVLAADGKPKKAEHFYKRSMELNALLDRDDAQMRVLTKLQKLQAGD